MGPIERIGVIQEYLKALIDDLEALKNELTGGTPPSFDEDGMGVLDQMKDLAQAFKQGKDPT